MVQATLLVSYLTSACVLLATVYGYEITYAGEGCECPSKLGYQVYVPPVRKPKPYERQNFGYRLEQPAKDNAKVSYHFDFTVEEPVTKRPKYPAKYDLYAKVDRIRVNRKDCIKYGPQADCGCDYCSEKKPQYRYVDQALREHELPQYKKIPSVIYFEPQTIYTPNSIWSANPKSNAIKRSRRDLHDVFFRKRLEARNKNDRPTRYVKLYHKNLLAKKKAAFFNFDKTVPAIEHKDKRPTNIVTPSPLALSIPFFNRPQSNRRKRRDIKGEYDLIVEEKEKLDLTAPEIVQFMPEILQPNFQFQQCCQLNAIKPEVTTPPPTTTVVSPTTLENTEYQQSPQDVRSERTRDQPIKRNIANYDDTFEHILNRQYSQIPPPQYVHPDEQINYKYLHDDSHMKRLLSTTFIPDPFNVNSEPYRFIGDLEAPARIQPQHLYEGTSSFVEPYLGAVHDSEVGEFYRDPVHQHVPHVQLEQIISNIMFRHPEFIETTSHVGGGLVDPEFDQKEQIKEFLQKLMNRRLDLF